jgi:hypothetical protein
VICLPSRTINKKGIRIMINSATFGAARPVSLLDRIIAAFMALFEHMTEIAQRSESRRPGL